MTLSADQIADRLGAHGYVTDKGLATVLSVTLALGKPLLLEGEAGVGKTECAKALAATLNARLIRLQCYEGIDVAHALYDWNYARQMLYMRALEGSHALSTDAVNEVFGREFLVRRPLLDAIDNDDAVPPLLLIDEIDRADDEFEAFLLEVLSDFQVTVPEIGTIQSKRPPTVLLTSNRTRELHHALRRRCLYHWIDFPSIQREVEIVRARLDSVPDRLVITAVAFVAKLRTRDLEKAPGVSETLDWIQALLTFGDDQGTTPDVVDATLGALLKYPEDLARVRGVGIETMLAEADCVDAAPG